MKFEKYLLIMFITNIIMVIGNGFLLANGLLINGYFSEKNYENKNTDIIIFDSDYNFTDMEKKFVYDVMNRINPLYYQFSEYIVITRDVQKIANEEYDQGCEKCNGFNANHKIYIDFSLNTEYLEQTICHELMHDFLKYNKEKDIYHDVVYDLGKKKVCFDK